MNPELRQGFLASAFSLMLHMALAQQIALVLEQVWEIHLCRGKKKMESVRGCSVETPAAGQPLRPCSQPRGCRCAAALTSFGSCAGLPWTTLNVSRASRAQNAAEMGLCCGVLHSLVAMPS